MHFYLLNLSTLLIGRGAATFQETQGIENSRLCSRYWRHWHQFLKCSLLPEAETEQLSLGARPSQASQLACGWESALPRRPRHEQLTRLPRVRPARASPLSASLQSFHLHTEAGGPTPGSCTLTHTCRRTCGSPLCLVSWVIRSLTTD